MTQAFHLPDLGEGVHEAEILAVPITVGQEVKEGDIILEVETDKAAVEIPSPCTGVVLEVVVKEGDLVKVDDVMIRFTTEDETVNVPPEKDIAPPKETGASTPQPKQDRSKIVPASPATRRLARELGVDLSLVPPTGSGSVVTADDVHNFAEKQKEAEPQPVQQENGVQVTSTAEPVHEPLPDFTQWGEIEKEPFRSIRKATATQMAKSWARIPHVTSQDTVDITKLEAFRKKHKEEIIQAGGRLTLTVFALKAIATALKQYPHFNSSLDLDSQEIIVKKYYNIGVAVDTQRGLIVPVIKDVDRKSIKEIAIELHQCIEQTHSGKIPRSDLLGGTFTLTNAGAMGGGFFTPIINYPQVAILGLGQGRMQPAVVEQDRGDYTIVPRLIMPIVLCFDHRVVDGADAIRFLKVIIEALEDPDELLITMT